MSESSYEKTSVVAKVCVHGANILIAEASEN